MEEFINLMHRTLHCFLTCHFCNKIYSITKRDYLVKGNKLHLKTFYCSMVCRKAFVQRECKANNIERFMSKLIKEKGPEGDCWEWQGYLDSDGYGQFYTPTKTYNAHRYSYELFVKRVPEGLVVRHKCDYPACVNPNHLEAGTQKDNMQDCSKRRRNKFGENHKDSKLTNEQAIQMRKERAEGKTLKWLSEKYGLSISSCSKVCIRQSYKHIEN